MQYIERFLKKMPKKMKRLRLTRTIGMVIGGLSTFLLLICALFGKNWLNQRTSWNVKTYTASESDVRTSTNQTDILQKEVKSYSGLWEICCGEDICQDQCKILEFMKPDFESKTTSFSLHLITSLRRWCIFPIVSLVMEGVGVLFFLISCCTFSTRLKLPLFGGVLLILSGLCNVLGIIIYISTNDKLGKRKTLDAQYGWSFYFSGGAFFFCEMLGVMMVQDVVKQVTKENEEKPDSDIESSLKIEINCEENLDPPPYRQTGTHGSSQRLSHLPHSHSGLSEMTLKGKKPHKLPPCHQLCHCDKLYKIKPTSEATEVIEVPPESIDNNESKKNPLISEATNDSFYVNMNEDLSYPFDKFSSKILPKKLMSSKCCRSPAVIDYECQCHRAPFSSRTCPAVAHRKTTDLQRGFQDRVLQTPQVKNKTGSKKRYSDVSQRLLKNVRNIVSFPADSNAPSPKTRDKSLKQRSSTETSASKHLPIDATKESQTIDRLQKFVTRYNRRLDTYPRPDIFSKQSRLTAKNNYEEAVKSNLINCCGNRVIVTAMPEENHRSQSTDTFPQPPYRSARKRNFATADLTNRSNLNSFAYPDSTNHLGMKHSHSCSRATKEAWLPQTLHRSESMTNVQSIKGTSHMLSNSLLSARRIRKYPKREVTDESLVPDGFVEGRGTAI